VALIPLDSVLRTERVGTEAIARLADADITVAERIEDIPDMIRARLAQGAPA